MTETAGIGHNQPPEVTFVDRLEEKNADLTARQAQLVIAGRRLPTEVKSDDDVAKINAWVVQARALARNLEARRVDTKEPYLARCRDVDGWFGEIKTSLLEDAEAAERRNGPYLLAKQQAEQARAREEARRRQEEADRKAAEAEAARKAKAEADAKAAAEEQCLREEEAARRAPVAANDAPTPQEENLRQAHVDVAQADEAADRAEAEARQAQLDADRALARSENAGALSRTQGGGGASRVEMKCVGRVVSWPQVIQSMGPLGGYLNEATTLAAIDRAAADPRRPKVPGVEFTEEPVVKTTASRAVR